MDEHLKQKSLKLLADPNKLLEFNKPKKKQERLKLQIEEHYNCDLTDKLYCNIKDSIYKDIIVYKTVEKLINQVIEYQNPKIIEYSLISKPVS
jgi:hypothetical protein